MKRALPRSILSTMLVASMFVALAQPAVARPRSWLLPTVDVACSLPDVRDSGRFTGGMDLDAVAVVKGELTVGGTISGTCTLGPSIDTTFRTTIEVLEASCSEASLGLGDVTIRDMLISLSEDPVVISADGAGNVRGALCALARTQNRSTKALVRTLNRVLALQG